MRKRILLPLLVLLLLCATLAASLLLFGRVVCLVDATYYRTVYRANERTLRRQLLLKGYFLSSVEVVPSEFDELILTALAEQNRTRSLHVVLSPLLTELMLQLNPADLVKMNLIGIGDMYADTAIFLSILKPTQFFDWQEAEKKLGTMGSALVLTQQDQKHHAFDSSRTVVQKEDETDQAFAERLETLAHQRGLLTLFAPQLGPWAMNMLTSSALSWVVDAAYLPLVEDQYLQGVVSDDLAQGVLSVLRGEHGMVQLTKRYFTEREIGGSWL